MFEKSQEFYRGGWIHDPCYTSDSISISAQLVRYWRFRSDFTIFLLLRSHMSIGIVEFILYNDYVAVDIILGGYPVRRTRFVAVHSSICTGR